MTNKKVLIICQSVHHGNTLKVAQVMAEELGAVIRKPGEVQAADLVDYDLIGFGSGIYNGKHHGRLFEFVAGLTPQDQKKAFIFSTASLSIKKLHEVLRQALLAKGFVVVDEFICHGFSDFKFLKYFFGGINKQRPNQAELAAARQFAQEIKEK